MKTRRMKAKDFDALICTPANVAKVASAVDAVYAAQIEAEYGERCPDYEPECCVCRAWKEFDDWRGASPQSLRLGR